jgi:hypothetical protein
MTRKDFEGMDEVELLLAIREAAPGVFFPDEATREDLIQHLLGLAQRDPDEDDLRGAGVRNRGPRSPTGTLRDGVEPET